MARPEISKVLIHKPGRLWLVLRSLFKDALKADHISGGIERIEPGGLLRSECSGASQDLRCSAMLVAQMSRPMLCSSVLRSTRLLQCFDQGVQLGQLSGHELSGVVGEVDLPAAPNKAVLGLRLFP